MIWYIIFFVILVISFFHNNKKKPLPGPTIYPIFGNALDLFRNEHRLLDWITDLHYQYGINFRIYLPFQPNFIFTSNPKNVEHVLFTNFSNYHKGPKFHEVSEDLLGNGIFAVDGDLWRNQRKVASQLFTVRIFKDVMQPVFHHHLEVFQQIIDKSISEKQPLDSQSLFYRFTLDSIGEIAFGINIGSLDGLLSNGQVSPGERFGKAFDSAQEVVHDRFLSPIPLTLRKLIHPGEYAFRSHAKYLNTWSYSVIKARRADPNTRNKQDLLSFFLNQKKEVGSSEAYSDEFLRDILLNFMVAGRDTTAQLLTWFFYVISKPENTEKKNKIYQEIDQVFGRGESSTARLATYEDVKKLKYLEAALTETLRLFPSVPKEIKMAVNDDVLPDGTKVWAGEWVAFIPYAMGRLVNLWEDPLTYKPERFMTKVATKNSNEDTEDGEEEKSSSTGPSEDTRAKGHPFKFVSFLGGPRLCLGQNMAYYEAKVVASTILRNYRFSLVPNQTITYANQLTLPAKIGIKMQFEKRQS